MGAEIESFSSVIVTEPSQLVNAKFCWAISDTLANSYACWRLRHFCSNRHYWMFTDSSPLTKVSHTDSTQYCSAKVQFLLNILTSLRKLSIDLGHLVANRCLEIIFFSLDI